MARLIVENGRMRGLSFDIPPGRSQIGRQADVGLSISDDTVSRQHAVLDNSGLRVVLTDLGSSNGTWINGQRLRATSELRDGDEVRVGAVSLRFSTTSTTHEKALSPSGPAAEPEGRSAGHSFGDVDGPVQTGDGQQYSAGRDQYLAGRDHYWDNRVRLDADYDPWDEIFQGKGIGRALMALGGVIALIGFGMWAYVLFSGASADIGDNPFELELVPGVPMAVAGFAAFAGGGILAGIGSGLSKAARKRSDQYRAHRRTGRWES